VSGPARKRALLIGVGSYADAGLAALPCVQADLREFGEVLRDTKVGSFEDVQCLTDPDAATLRQAVHDFLDRSEPDELAVVYLTGHGERDAATGEFHVLARDTRLDRLSDTGVSAGFLNDRLDDCRARQRVVILDSCKSGGFATGLRTRDAKGAAAPSAAPLATRGVVVLSSSRAVEASFAGDEPDDPSRFTGELVRALRDGTADLDRDGLISVTELHQHLNSRMRAQGTGGRQVPVMSTAGVDGAIYLAKAPLRRAAGRRADASGRLATESPGAAGSAQPGWQQLIGYYRECVRAENSSSDRLVFSPRSADYACVPGQEQIFSGTGSDQDGLLPVPAGIEPLVERAGQDQADLVYGYPVVVIHQNRERQAVKPPKCAPLLIRRIEIVQQDDGGLRLRPYGEPEPNPAFADYWLGREESEHLQRTFSPDWGLADHDSMVKAIRYLLRDEFGLDIAEELRPDRLADHIDIASPANGARNAAVVMAMKSAVVTKKLIGDLDDIEEKQAQIRGTALAALLDPTSADRSPPAVEPVAVGPLNTAQARILEAALSRRLTVATGPPGTGKSALVVNILATAVAAGQTVLLASTNNRAVDEVVERCAKIAPGLAIRTGSRTGETDYQEAEKVALRGLLALPPAPVSLATAGARHSQAARAHSAVLGLLARQGRAEGDLLAAGTARATCARTLAEAAPEFAQYARSCADAELERYTRRGSRLARARLFGAARRLRFLRSLALSDAPGAALSSPELCAAVSAYAAAELHWRKLSTAPELSDSDLRARLADSEQTLREASTGLTQVVVAEYARQSRGAIQGLLSLGDRSPQQWRKTREALAGARAWAVTSLSARRFPPDPALFDLVVIDEASQCSIAAVLPLLFRARHALIIGDPLQLPHIAQLPAQAEAEVRERFGIDGGWLADRSLGYRDHSCFHAFERANEGSILLDEHFRCHPRIARIASSLFYAPRDKPLTILTDPHAMAAAPDMPAATWIDEPGSAHRSPAGSSWVNWREADRVSAGVRRLLEELPADATVGIVTPFAAQAALLGKTWAHESGRVRVGTAHRFQGGECDAVIFSLVAADGMSAGALRFLEENPNLWNVAITRARAHLFVVGDASFWSQRDGLGRRLLDELGTPAALARPWPHGAVMRDLLFDRLTADARAEGGVELSVPCSGYTADAVVSAKEGSAAVLLDTGVSGAVEPDRHLRVHLRRAELLADPAAARGAIRVPAWRLYDGDWRPFTVRSSRIG